MADAHEERYFTYADYKQWELKKGERYELVYGVPYAMSAPSDRHQAILIALAASCYNYFKDKPCKVRPAPYDVRLFYEEDESDETVVQPDLVVICDEKKRGPEGCRGAPDFVAEILSPSNTAIEMARKFELYRTAGVREYWLLDGEEKALLAYRFTDGQVVTRSYNSGDIAPADIFPGLEIALDAVFAE